MNGIMIQNDYIDKLQNDLNILQERFDAYKLLKTKYGNYLNNKIYDCESMSCEPSKIIWTCWFQGIDNAPDLVKSCYNSVKDNFVRYEKILLTADNFERYVTIDPIVMKKWRDGIISNTAFSNILRLELLIKHGGLWLDSTVFCTDNTIPEFISKSPLFVYSNWKWISGDVRPISTWLMSSCKNHVMLKAVRDLLVNYWHENDELQTYFIFHMFFEMAIEKYPEVWKQTPKISNLPPHMMQFEFAESYSEFRFNQLKEMSGFHKLTYKLPSDMIYDKKSLYSYIANNF